jgi:hypothetical protein
MKAAASSGQNLNRINIRGFFAADLGLGLVDQSQNITAPAMQPKRLQSVLSGT